MSTGDEASVFARFHFRPHFFQHAGFRIVSSQAPLQTDLHGLSGPARQQLGPLHHQAQGHKPGGWCLFPAQHFPILLLRSSLSTHPRLLFPRVLPSCHMLLLPPLIPPLPLPSSFAPFTFFHRNSPPLLVLTCPPPPPLRSAFPPPTCFPLCSFVFILLSVPFLFLLSLLVSLIFRPLPLSLPILCSSPSSAAWCHLPAIATQDLSDAPWETRNPRQCQSVSHYTHPNQG